MTLDELLLDLLQGQLELLMVSGIQITSKKESLSRLRVVSLRSLEPVQPLGLDTDLVFWLLEATSRFVESLFGGMSLFFHGIWEAERVTPFSAHCISDQKVRTVVVRGVQKVYF